MSQSVFTLYSDTSTNRHTDGFVQECSISSALAMEILQSCAKPWIWYQCICRVVCPLFIRNIFLQNIKNSLVAKRTIHGRTLGRPLDSWVAIGDVRPYFSSTVLKKMTQSFKGQLSELSGWVLFDYSHGCPVHSLGSVYPWFAWYSQSCVCKSCSCSCHCVGLRVPWRTRGTPWRSWGSWHPLGHWAQGRGPTSGSHRAGHSPEVRRRSWLKINSTIITSWSHRAGHSPAVKRRSWLKINSTIITSWSHRAGWYKPGEPFVFFQFL